MLQLLMPNNAIAYAQFHLRGGWTMALTTVSIAAAVGLAVLALGAMTGNADLQGMAGAWVSGLMILQAIVIGIVCVHHAGDAIVNDRKTGMLESHRLMPQSPAAAICGYLAGANSQVMALAIMVFIAGAVSSQIAGLPIMLWIVPNIVLLVFGLFAASVLMFMAFVGRGNTNAGVLVVVLGALAALPLSALLPQVRALATPMLGESIFQLRDNSMTLTPAMGVGMAWQLAIAAVFFIGATRRYRSPERLGLGIGLSTVLLGLWVSLGVVTMLMWAQFSTGNASRMDASPQVHFVCVIATASILALTPLTAAARRTSARVRGLEREAEGTHIAGPVMALLLTAIIALAFVAAPYREDGSYARFSNVTTTDYFNQYGIYTEAPADEIGKAIGLTAVVIYASLLGASYLARWRYLHAKSTAVLLGVWWVLTVVVPMVLAVMYAVMTDQREPPVTNVMFSVSPVGALAAIWTTSGAFPVVGVVIQCLIAIVPGILYYRTAAKRRTLSTP